MRITPDGHYLAAEDTIDTTGYAVHAVGNVRDADLDFARLHASARRSARLHELTRAFYVDVLPTWWPPLRAAVPTGRRRGSRLLHDRENDDALPPRESAGRDGGRSCSALRPGRAPPAASRAPSRRTPRGNWSSPWTTTSPRSTRSGRRSRNSLRVIGQIFEGLVTLDAENELEAVLAERWSHNETYDTWTFEIRRGVYFHEDDVFGERRTREVTADDVAFSFERLVSPESYPAFVLADTIAGVSEFQSGEAPGVAGIKVLGAACGRVPAAAARFHLSAPDHLALVHGVPPGGGGAWPRRLRTRDSHRHRSVRLARRSDTEVVLERNERYWRTVDGNVERLVFRVVRNEQLRLSELRNGRLGSWRCPRR